MGRDFIQESDFGENNLKGSYQLVVEGITAILSDTIHVIFVNFLRDFLLLDIVSIAAFATSLEWSPCSDIIAPRIARNTNYQETRPATILELLQELQDDSVVQARAHACKGTVTV